MKAVTSAAVPPGQLPQRTSATGEEPEGHGRVDLKRAAERGERHE